MGLRCREVGVFLIALGLGACAIALWLAVRFDRFAPRDFGRALIHAALALAVGWLAVPAAIAAVMATGAGPLVALFTTAFPALVYIFLAGFWMVKHIHGLLLYGSGDVEQRRFFARTKGKN
jgi:hypothetical protein